jgi:DNA-binding transcriptional LysR family regulator
MAAFHAAHPRVELLLTEAGSNVLIEQLAAGTVDMALVTLSDALPVGGSALVRTPLLTEELVVVSSAAQPPVAAGEGIDLQELARLPLVYFADTYDLRATTDAAFRSAGLAPAPVIEGAEMDAVLRFVERGLGVAVVPAMVLLDRPELRSVRLINPRLARTIGIAHRSDVNPTRAAAAMRRVIVRTAGELVQRDPATMELVSDANGPSASGA